MKKPDNSQNKTRTEYYPNGQKSLEQISTGQYSWKRTEWYMNGQIKKKYYNSNIKHIGNYKSWYENGQKESENNKEKHTTWYENGQKESESIKGNYKSWYENGQKESENNKEKHTTWYENGHKFKEFQYLQNKVVLKTLWHSNSKKMLEFNFKNGKKHGDCIEWFKNGEKSSEKTYKDDILIDSWDLTQEKNEEKSLRNEIIRIREKIDILSGWKINTSYDPIKDFPNKDEYPLDFQIFMEEIGVLDMGAGNTHIIEIHVPLLCDPSDEKFNETLSDSYLHNLKSLEDSLFIEAVNGSSDLEIKAKDYMVVGADCNVSTYGFYTCIKPYEFVTTYNLNPASNFIAWLKSLLNSDLEIELYEELGRDFF